LIAEVTILSTSAAKEKDAKVLGAHHFVVTIDPEQLASVKSSFDFILDTVEQMVKGDIRYRFVIDMATL